MRLVRSCDWPRGSPIDRPKSLWTCIRRINAQEVGTLEDDLKGMLSEAKPGCALAQGAYETYRRDAQHELLKGDVTRCSISAPTISISLVEIEAERAKLTRAEEELAKRTPLGTMTQSIDKSSTMMEAARTATNSSGSVAGTPDAERLRQRRLHEAGRRGRNRPSKPGGSGKKTRTDDRPSRKWMASSSPNSHRLYVTETALERLKDDVEISRKAFQSVAERYQGAKLAATALTPRVQVVVPATPPERPGQSDARTQPGVGRRAWVGRRRFYGSGALCATERERPEPPHTPLVGHVTS